MSYEISGTLHHVGNIEHISENFSKRLVVIKVVSGDQGQYEELIPLDFCNRMTDKVEGVPIGTRVSAKFGLRGREWTPQNGGETRYFLSANAYFFEYQPSAAASQAPPPPSAPNYGQPMNGAQGAPPPPPQGGRFDDVEIPF